MTERNIEVSRYFQDAVETLTEQLRQMNDIEAQLRAAWQEQPSNAFTTAMNQWEVQFTTVARELNRMIEVMERGGTR